MFYARFKLRRDPESENFQEISVTSSTIPDVESGYRRARTFNSSVWCIGGRSCYLVSYKESTLQKTTKLKFHFCVAEEHICLGEI